MLVAVFGLAADAPSPRWLDWLVLGRAVVDYPSLVYSLPKELPPPDKRLRLMRRMARSEFAGAEARWYRLNPGQLVLRFPDDSWLAFADMMFMGRRRARRVASALRGETE